MIEKMKKLNELGISYATIAKGIGVTRQSLTYWMHGDFTPTAANEAKFFEWLKKLQEV